MNTNRVRVLGRKKKAKLLFAYKMYYMSRTVMTTEKVSERKNQIIHPYKGEINEIGQYFVVLSRLAFDYLDTKRFLYGIKYMLDTS